MPTINDLRQQAATIKNATQVGENTATRVGTTFETVADLLEGASVGQGVPSVDLSQLNALRTPADQTTANPTIYNVTTLHNLSSTTIKVGTLFIFSDGGRAVVTQILLSNYQVDGGGNISSTNTSQITMYYRMYNIVQDTWSAWTLYAGGGGGGTIDPYPVSGSDNAVASNGVFERLQQAAPEVSINDLDNLDDYVDMRTGESSAYTLKYMHTQSSTWLRVGVVMCFANQAQNTLTQIVFSNCVVDGGGNLIPNSATNVMNIYYRFKQFSGNPPEGMTIGEWSAWTKFGDSGYQPDNEDIDLNASDQLQFANKSYDASAFSGLGRVYLRKNIVISGGVEKNVLTQAMVNTANTIYHIQYDYDLNGQTITLPAGCVLEFDGGSVKNGTIIGQNTIVRAFNKYIFRSVSVSGVFNETYHSNWFVEKNDGSDCTTDMNFLFSSGNGHTIIIDEGKYAVNANYTLAQGTKLKGYSLCVGRNNVVRKSHFYLHDCSGTFLDCSAGYIVIENLTFDGTNGITNNHSTTIEQFISANSQTGFIEINGCEICGTSYLGACAVNLGQSMWVEIKNSQIHHVINGYAVIFNGSNTTINFHKVYFTYNRQSLNISSDSGFTKFSCCVFESSYTLGRITGSNIFDTCHFENIGYDLSEHYEGLTTIYESDSTPLDSFAELVRGKTEFANCVFYHCFNGSHHTYGFRLYPNTLSSTYIRNGYLLINNCLLGSAIYNSFELSDVLYVYGNNTSVAEYFKIEMNCEYVSENSSIYPYVKKLKGYGHARLHVYGNRNVEMCLEYGVAHYKFISNTYTGFLVPSNMPLELLDDEYCVKGFITYPTASHVHNKEYVSYAESFTLVNTSAVAGTSFQLPTDANAYPAYYIKVGDKFTIYTDNATAVTGTITAKTNTAVTFSVGFTIGSTPRILNIYATRPCGDSYGICSNLPTGLTTRQVGCIAIKGTSTYRWNGTAWMDVTGTAVQ